MLDSPPQGVDPTIIKRMMEVLNQEVMELTWRVEVYNESLVTGKVRNALVKNEDKKPAEGMGAGEKAWWTAELFAVRIEGEMLKDKSKSREDAASLVAAAWQKQIGEDFLIGVVEEVTDSAFVKGGLRQPRNSPVGPENISKLFKESTCMEMVLNTRSALGMWSNCLTREQATLMLKPRGAALVAHFWLSTLTALKVFNVQYPEGLSLAKAYLKESKLDKVSSEGDQAAREYWNKLHTRHERSPQPLGLYDERAQRHFGTTYRRATADPEFGQDILNSNFDNRRAISKMREVFERFAEHYKERRDVVGRAVCASLRLYARLPLHAAGQTGDFFYPEALLPSTDCMRDLEARWNRLEGIHGETLTLLELLISKQNIAWTVGALGSSQATNTCNWYNRSRGLHQVVCHCYAAVQYGSVEARLSRALQIIQDPDLVTGLTGISIPVSNTLRQLIIACSASKSGKTDYPILAQRLGDWPRYKSADKMKANLAKFRMALKHAVRSDDPSTQVAQTVVAHPVSQTIGSDFWSTFNFVDWVLGWNNKHKDKDIKTVSAVVGWGYVIDTLCQPSGLPLLLRTHPAEAHPVLLAAERLYAVKGGDPWWRGKLILTELVNAAKEQRIRVEDSREVPPSERQETQTAGTSDLVIRVPASIQARRSQRISGPEQTAVLQQKTHKPRKKTPMRMVVEIPLSKKGVPHGQPTLQDEINPHSANPTPSCLGDGPEMDVDPEMGSLDLPVPCSETGGSEPSPQFENTSGEASGDEHRTASPPPSHLEEAFEGGWDVRPTFSERTKKELSWEIRPGYVLAEAAYSTRVLQNLDGQVLISRDRRASNDAVDEETIRRIREARVSHPKVLEGITIERSRLRLSINRMAIACASMPYGYDWFHLGFQAVVSNMKDVYVALVARLFMEHLDLSIDEAINEAIGISWTDGLHGRDVAWLDDSGILKVNFATTLTGDLPSKNVKTEVSYGRLDSEEDQTMQSRGIPSVMELLKSKFKAARGYGLTEKACELAGVDGVALRAKVLKAKLQGEERFISKGGPAQFFLESEEGVDQAVEELLLRQSHDYNAELPFGLERRRTGRERNSAFCTGRFTLSPQSSTNPEDVNASRLRQELDLTLHTVQKTWKRVCDADLQAFRDFQKGQPTLEDGQS